MAKVGMPRRGSMQFWPRKRAKRSYARVRYWPSKDKKLQGFVGYKVGMTQVTYVDNAKNSMMKGQVVAIPVSIIECPPVKIYAARLYKDAYNGPRVYTQINGKADSELGRKISLGKKAQEVTLDSVKTTDFTDLRLLVYTQPKLTGIGKKKPELMEIGIGGSNEEKLKFVKEKLGKEITVAEVLAAGEQIDIHAITKGKGFQGPIKRFGITKRQHKSEKSIRNPGSLGGWVGQGHVMYRVAHAGQTGGHQRVDYNKWIVKISDNAKEINPDGGFLHYGLVKNTYILVKGSIPGTRNRMVTLVKSIRENKKIPKDAPSIEKISLKSQQGVR